MATFVALVAAGAAPARAEGSDGVSDNYAMLADQAPAAAAPAWNPVTGRVETLTTGTIGRRGRRAAAGRDLQGGAGQSPYRHLIAAHAAANGIPFALADAVVRIESRYNPRAQNRGAVGLMQIKTQTARSVGYAGGADGLTDPDTNLRFGMRYLAQGYRMSGGNTCATLMRYQSGHFSTRMSGANRAYCGKARSIMASLN